MPWCGDNLRHRVQLQAVDEPGRGVPPFLVCGGSRSVWARSGSFHRPPVHTCPHLSTCRPVVHTWHPIRHCTMCSTAPPPDSTFSNIHVYVSTLIHLFTLLTSRPLGLTLPKPLRTGSLPNNPSQAGTLYTGVGTSVDRPFTCPQVREKSLNLDVCGNLMCGSLTMQPVCS